MYITTRRSTGGLAAILAGGLIAALTAIAGPATAAPGVGAGGPGHDSAQPAATETGSVPAGLRAALRARFGDRWHSAASTGIEPQKGGYSQTTELTASDGLSGDYFASVVAMSADGTSAVVGAQFAQNGTGAAYIFTLGSKGWSQTEELPPVNPEGGMAFGTAVAMSADGTEVVVGAPTAGELFDGSADVYTLRKGHWKGTELLASDDQYNNYFGESVAISADGSAVAVSALAAWQDPAGGAAYVFDRTGKKWKQTGEMSGSEWGYVQLGNAVALSPTGSTLIATVPASNLALVFQQSKKRAWKQGAQLTPSDGQSQDAFGVSVAMAGSVVLIGSEGHNDVQGAAYVYTGKGKNWTQAAELTASNGVANDEFGRSVALSANGKVAVIGANRVDGGVGAAYVFRENKSAAWAQTAELTASNGSPDDWFGTAVGVGAQGKAIIVGAFGVSDYTGAAYIFNK